MNKKIRVSSFILFTALVFSSCIVSASPSPSFEDKVATQAAVVFTATALAEHFNTPSQTPQPPEALDTATPEPTATLPSGDPLQALGEPTARDTLANSSIWFKDSSSFSNEFAVFSAEPGAITAVSKKSGGPIWYDYYEKRPQNLALEATLTAEACSGSDAYGLLFRGQDISAGPNFFFSVKCNGAYDLYTFGASNNIKYLISNRTHPAIITGSGAVNTLSIWAKDSRIRLYVNGEFLEEIESGALNDDGYVGFFIWSVNGAGLKVRLDEIAYWAIN